MHYQHTNTSLQTTFHILNVLQQNNTRSRHETKKKKLIRTIQIITIPTFNINIHFSNFITKSHILNTLLTYKYIHFNQNHVSRGPLRKCSSIPSDASRLPYYCTPPGCVKCAWCASCVATFRRKKRESDFKINDSEIELT